MRYQVWQHRILKSRFFPIHHLSSQPAPMESRFRPPDSVVYPISNTSAERIPGKLRGILGVKVESRASLEPLDETKPSADVLSGFHARPPGRDFSLAATTGTRKRPCFSGAAAAPAAGFPRSVPKREQTRFQDPTFSKLVAHTATVLFSRAPQKWDRGSVRYQL